MLNLPYAAGTKYDKRNLGRESDHSKSLTKVNKTPNSMDQMSWKVIKKRNVDTAKVGKKKRIIMLEMSKHKNKYQIKSNNSKQITPMTKDQLKEIFEKYKLFALKEGSHNDNSWEELVSIAEHDNEDKVEDFKNNKLSKKESKSQNSSFL